MTYGKRTLRTRAPAEGVLVLLRFTRAHAMGVASLPLPRRMRRGSVVQSHARARGVLARTGVHMSTAAALWDLLSGGVRLLVLAVPLVLAYRRRRKWLRRNQ